MPNFFKNFFKRSSSRSKRTARPQRIPAYYETPSPSPSPPRQDLTIDDLQVLADRLRRELDSSEQLDSPDLLHAVTHGREITDETMERLLEVLEEVQRNREEETITPLPQETAQGPSALERAAKAANIMRRRKGKDAMTRVHSSTNGKNNDEMAMAVEACTAAIGKVSSIPQTTLMSLQ